MKLLRVGINYYLTLSLSLYYICRRNSTQESVYRGIGQAGSLLLCSHLANVLTLVFFLATPRQLRALASNFAGGRRPVTLVVLFLTFVIFGRWLVGALRRKVEEVSKSDDSILQVQDRWRIVAISYVALSMLGVVVGFTFAVSRSG